MLYEGIEMNIKSRILTILMLLISFQSNCFTSKLLSLADSARQRTKKAIENITLKDVVVCAGGVAAVGLAVYLVKQNHDIQAQNAALIEKFSSEDLQGIVTAAESLKSLEVQGVIKAAGYLKEARPILDKVADQQEEFAQFILEILKAANTNSGQMLEKVNGVILKTRNCLVDHDNRLKAQFDMIEGLQGKYETLSKWIEGFKTEYLETQPT